MKTLLRLALGLAALLVTVGNLPADTKSIDYFETIQKDATPVVGEQYYLRHCIRYEPGKDWPTTNYWTDISILVPINSKVTLNSLGSKTLQIKIEKTGQVLNIENVQKYSQKDTATIAKNLLTRKPVPIEKFDDKTAKNIANGILALGMTKEQVVMTRGYPPGHRTPSLDIDTWTYWNNRVVNHAYVFQDGVLIKGPDLQ